MCARPTSDGALLDLAGGCDSKVIHLPYMVSIIGELATLAPARASAKTLEQQQSSSRAAGEC